MKKLLLLSFIFLLNSCGSNSSKKIELIPYSQKGLFGYFNFEGKIIINPQFRKATVFRDGLALVQVDNDEGLWGFIDSDGKYVIKPMYKDATVFNDGLAWVTLENSAPNAINKQGEIKFSLKDANRVRYFSEGLAAFSVLDKENSYTEKWGFVDKNGKQVINAQFKEVAYFLDGFCAVQNSEGKWGYIDKNGKIIINHQFDTADSFVKGNASVSLDGKSGIINDKGEYTINPQFSNIFKDGDIYTFVQDKKRGWCDKEGKYLINPQFDDALLFLDNDLCPVESSNSWGYIDKEGKIIINPQFEQAFPFIGDKAIVKSGKSYGVIDNTGKFIVNPQFEKISDDLIFYMLGPIYKGTSKSEIETDYINLNEVLAVVNFESPENLNFEDQFNNILDKFNLDINSIRGNYIFQNKEITNEVNYSFSIGGNIREYNYDTYQYFVTNENPTNFFYNFQLRGKAYGRAESIQKEFETKLNGFTLVKKGYISGEYISIYKGAKSIVLIGNSGPSSPFIQILPTSFEINKNYLDSILPNKKESQEKPYEKEYSSEYYDEGPAVEAAQAVEEEYYEYD